MSEQSWRADVRCAPVPVTEVDSWVGWVLTALALVVVVLGIGLRIVALGVIPGNRKPSTGMAWLLLILLVPIIGFAVFLLFGRTALERRRHERQQQANTAIRARTSALVAPDAVLDHSPYLRSVVDLNRRLGSLPLSVGNHVELLPDYAASIQAMTDAVDSAQVHVDVEFYITALDHMTEPLFVALEAAASRGVTVRLLFDHLGSRGIPGYAGLVRRLEDGPIQWHPMLPIHLMRGPVRRPDLRNHRKLMVIDGVVGFTGSQNLTEPGYNKPKNHALGREWVELMVRLHGPVVTSLEAVFASDWLVETGELLEVAPHVAGRAPEAAIHDVPCQVVPSGPGYVAENNLRLFTTLIYSATRRISLTSPYFVPDESLLYAVTTAAQRGVDVELFVSELADQFMVGHAQASYYRALLEAGVKIWLYPAPYVLHSKHFSLDDDVAVIGSSNMDLRSFALNYEISLMLIDREVVQRLRAVEDGYRNLSTELTLAQWLTRPARTRYVDNVMRLTAALQ